MNKDKDVLVLNNLSKTYYTATQEVVAIKDLSMRLKEGEIVAVVGPSGCGKSTMLNILGGFESKSDGDIIYPSGKKKIGYMFQSDCLFDWLNILDNCLLGLKIKGNVSKDSIDEVTCMLKEYGLGEFIWSYPRNLSGGMRQRCALIRTLATNPDIILLDEPYSSLDANTRLVVADDVYKIIKDKKKSTIIITHDVAEAVSIADRVIVLSSRPSKVKCVFDIKLTGASSPINNRNCPEFNKYYKLIWESIDHNV